MRKRERKYEKGNMVRIRNFKGEMSERGIRGK